MIKQLYTTTELLEMTPEELAVAQANDYVKPETEQRMGEAIFGPGYVGPATEVAASYLTTLPEMAKPSHPSPPQDPYAVKEWGTDLYDFRVPSGQLCQLRRLRPERLIGSDLLDKITRLPALAQEQIQQAQGQPPTMAMPTDEQLGKVTEVLNELLPLVVVQPQLWVKPDNEERVAGRVYVEDVDLFDRIAIMNRATQGVAKLDNFRP